MTRVTDAELIQACANSIPIFQANDFWSFVLFSLMHNTGIRYIEGYEVSRWTDNEDGTFTLDTAKDSNNRIIPASDIPVVYQNLIRSEYSEFDSMRYVTSTRLFRKYFPIYPLTVGNKDVSTHVYRYSIVKKMYAAGSTIQQISDYLGEVDNKNTQGYLDAEVYTS